MKNALSRVIRRISESAAIAAFGSTFLEKMRIFFILAIRKNASAFPLVFNFSYNNVPFSLTFLSHADLMLFHEIFAGHPYKIRTKSAPEYIVDLGANIGVSTLYLHTSYPTAKIIAVEANPALIPRLKETLSGIEGVVIIPCAVSGEDGTVSFYVDEERPLGSSLIHRGNEEKKISVEARSLTSIQHEVGFPHIDLIKFDIEGAEKDVFENYSMRSSIRAIVGEVHEDLMGATSEEFEKLWDGMMLRRVSTGKEGRFNMYGFR